MDTILNIMIELRKKYKAGSAAEILSEAVLIGDIPGGTTLTQNELASSLGTSRMPVREALIVLEHQGLIERFTNQHIQTVSIDEISVREIFSDMSVLEMNVLKTLNPDKLSELSLCTTQYDYHNELIRNSRSLMRRKILEIITEIYLGFVLRHSAEINKIDAVFMNLISALKSPADFGVIRAGYAVYVEVLASEFMRIRTQNEGKTSE